MALAFHIKDSEDIPMLFSAYDEYTSIVNSLFGRVLTPNDDYYTAPWAFLPNIRSGNGGWIVFTTMVPWLHCDDRKSSSEWRKHYFHRARKIMESKWEEYVDHVACIPSVGYPEKMIENLELEEHMGNEVITFTKNGYYPDKYDVSKSLEELAVQVTCSSMGWPYPNDWQQERVRILGCRKTEYDIFDLTGYDPTKKNVMQNIGNTTNAKEKEDSSDKKRMKYTPQPSKAATDAPLEIGKQGNDDDEREKENNTTAVASVGGGQQRREYNPAAYQEGGYYNHHPRAERRGEYNPAKYQPKEEDTIPLPPLDGPLVSNDSTFEKKEEEDEYYQYRYSTPQYNPAYDEASYYGYGYNNDDGGGFNYGHDGDSFYD